MYLLIREVFRLRRNIYTKSLRNWRVNLNDHQQLIIQHISTCFQFIYYYSEPVASYKRWSFPSNFQDVYVIFPPIFSHRKMQAIKRKLTAICKIVEYLKMIITPIFSTGNDKFQFFTQFIIFKTTKLEYKKLIKIFN